MIYCPLSLLETFNFTIVSIVKAYMFKIYLYIYMFAYVRISSLEQS